MTRYIKEPKDNGFTILIDVQEKKNLWTFDWPTKVKHLKVGDYSIAGYEDLIAIEKKSGLGELLTDLAMSYRPTFKRFLTKMAAHPIRCIIVGEELSIWSVRRALKIIEKKSKGKCQLIEQTVWLWVSKIVTEYGIPVLFLDKQMRDIMLPEIFRAAYRRAQEVRL